MMSQAQRSPSLSSKKGVSLAHMHGGGGVTSKDSLYTLAVHQDLSLFWQALLPSPSKHL